MTKKDYELVAAAVRETRESTNDPAHCQALDNVSRELADMMERLNPRFDRKRFLGACGVPPTMKTVTNLMSGKPIQIAEDTPLCCDPSSETYWSM